MIRTVRAFAIAPIIPPLLYWIGTEPTLASLPGIMLYGAAISYLVTLAIGGPAYRLIRTHSCLRASHVLIISAATGAVTLSLMGGGLDVRGVLLGMLFGLAAGLTFWLLWRGNAAEPRVAADRAAPGR
jgi:hypothetical protein